MEEKKVSVIIPCYNVEAYIQEAVMSVVNQTYSDWEIILVDDGSTDGTSQICDKFAVDYPQIQVIHKKNGGLSEARNVGISLASGEYIYFLDADDFIDPQMLSNLTQEMEKSQSDFAFFDSNVITEGNIETTWKPNIYIRQLPDRMVQLGNKWLEQLIPSNGFVSCIPFHFYRRGFLIQNKLTFKRGILHEDELFSFLVYVKAKKALRISQPYYFRRVRQGSIMASQNIKEMYRSLNEIFHYLLQLYDKKEFRKEDIFVFTLFLDRLMGLMVFRYCNISEQERKNSVKQFKRLLLQYLKVTLKERRFTSTKSILMKYYFLCRYR